MHLADASLPLVATLSANAASVDAEGWTTLDGCDFQIKGGTPGDENSGDYYFADGILHIRSSAPITVRTAPTVDGDGNPILNDEGRPVPSQTSNTIQIDPGVKGELTLAGVDINTGPDYRVETPSLINLITNKYDTADGTAATDGSQILHPTSLYLKIKDGTCNTLYTSFVNAAGIRCGEGSILVIDDELDNRTATNKEAVVQGGKIVGDTTLVNGTFISDSSPSSMLDSPNPGELLVKSGYSAAGIGSTAEENGGTITINGGLLTVRVQDCDATSDGSPSFGAGIGAGSFGDGTATTIKINGGIIDSQGGVHGAGVGGSVANNGARYSRPWSTFYQYVTVPNDAIKSKNSDKTSTYFNNSTANVAGDIVINGGFVRSKNGFHGAAFGNGCCSTNDGHTITVTGGTLLPSSSRMIAEGVSFPDIGGLGGYVVITGGSIYCSDPVTKFQGIGGTAWSNHAYEAEGYNANDPNDPNKVEMITIDLAKELPEGQRTVPVMNWELSVDGVRQNYGAPSYLDEGKLYLWLPKSVRGTTVKVDMSYYDPTTGEERAIAPLFIEDAVNSGIELKRYVEFDLPESYTSTLTKYYDGRPLEALDLTSLEPPLTGWVTNEAGERVSDDRELTDPSTVTYRYQHLRRAANGELVPFGAEASSGAEMPSNAGLLQFTMDSKQYANTDGFKESYWGHRATGQCEILPISSVVVNLSATWTNEPDDDRRPGGVEHAATEALTFSADITRGATVDGTEDGAPTAGTCQAPEGRVQLYVDGDPVGTPIDIRFEDETDDKTRAVTAKKNAERVDNGEGGSYTHFTYTASPTDSDWILPASTETNRHKVSLRFLPPTDEQIAEGTPANYLASEEPQREDMDDPDSPWVDVTVEPVDPNPTVESRPDPDKTDDRFPDPAVQTDGGTKGGPDENGHPVTIHNGTIRTTYGEPTEANPHPGRVILAIDTPSSAPIKVTDNTGNVITAEFATDGDGNPVRDESGGFVLVIDPIAVGGGALKIVQEANGAFNGTEWNYAVKVNPDASIPPEPRLAKRAENLTHPEGPTQPGDRIRYTIEASNTAAGSLWTDVVVSDALPACLKMDEDSVRLASPASGFEGTLRKAAGDMPSLGEFTLSAPGADGRPVLSVAAGSASSASPAVATFECEVLRGIDFASASAAELDLANVATATGTRPNPDDPDRPLEDPDRPGEPVPVAPNPTDPATPPGPDTVVPADPGAGDVRVTKTVENLTRPRENVTHVGDKLRYTITLENVGPADSVLYDASIADPLPKGIEPINGTLRLVGPNNDGPSTPVADQAYRRPSRTLAVSVGDLWGGQTWTLTFECEVGAEAVGTDVANIALVFGTTPSEDPGHDPAAPARGPGDPVDLPAPGSNPVTESDPATPPEVRPDDPEGGDVSIAKTARNTTRDDGTVYVGDTVRYEVRLWNSVPGTGWIDAVVRDDMPRGVEPISGTISLALPDGSVVEVTDAAYDPKSRILAVAVGRLYGGQEARLAFDALVTEEAVGANIGNVAAGYGTLPSMRDPSDPELVPGEPFSPAEGWDAYGARRDAQTIRTDPVYPEGADKDGGVIDDGKPADDSATIAHKLAQTGDRAAAAALGLSTAAALAACALALASRRRDRRIR